MSGVGKAAVRDEKKRATHNEVERRRRDKINGWINKLAKIVPSCNDDNTKQGQVHQNSVQKPEIILTFVPFLYKLLSVQFGYSLCIFIEAFI